MCGVPVHAAESYLARLIRGGNRVAIAEQIESPAEARKARGSKALVDRAIVRLVTPGTLTEEALLDSAAANWLAAVGQAGEQLAVAAADISTGRFELIACGPATVRRAGAPVACRNNRRGSHCADRTTGGKADLTARRRTCAQEPVRAARRSTGWIAVARRTGRGGRAADLSRRDPERRCDPARGAAPDRPIAPCGDRRGDPREPGADALRFGHGGWQPARRDRPLSDGGGAASAGRRHRRAADTSGQRSGPAGAGRLAACRCAAPRTRARRTETMPDFARGLARLAAQRGSPRDLALLRDGWALRRAASGAGARTDRAAAA